MMVWRYYTALARRCGGTCQDSKVIPIDHSNLERQFVLDSMRQGLLNRTS